MAVSRFDRVAAPWVSLRPPARRRRRILISLIAWWQTAELDRQLAAGVSPDGAVLAPWARRITARRARRRIAHGLSGALRSAQDAPVGFTAAVRPHAREVLAAGAVLAALDRRLRAPEPVTSHGVAMLRLLLVDGTSPLYQPDEPGALGSRLRAAAAAPGARRPMRLTARDGWPLVSGAEISPTLEIGALLGRIAGLWVPRGGSDALIAPIRLELRPGSVSACGETIA